MRRRKSKPKDLAPPGTLNPNPEAVLDEQFAAGDFFDARDIVQVKYEMLRRVANGQSVAETIRAFGFSSRQVFYRARAAFQQSGLAGLVPTKHRPKKNSPLERSKLTRRMRKRIEKELRDSDLTLASAFVSDDLEIDFVMRKVRVGKKNVRLTPKE